MNTKRQENKEAYTAPQAEVLLLKGSLNLLETLSVDLYLEGEVDGYELVGDY